MKAAPVPRRLTGSRVVNEVTGGLDQPDSGILFTVPISYEEGLGKYQ